MKKLLIITQKVDESDQLLGFFIDWIIRFAKKFDKVTVLCLEKGEFNLPENVKVLGLGKNKGVSKLGQLFNFYKYIYTLKDDYGAVFVHMNPVWVILGGLWWRMANKKIFFWYTSGGITVKLRLAEKFADTIFTASKESFRLPSKKIIITGHGIDTELFKPNLARSNLKEGVPRFDLEGIKILSIGRINPVKNYETLVGAAKIMKNQNVEFSITIIGEPALKKDKDYEQKLKSLIGQLGLKENFNFLGKINHRDLVSYYQSHDLFVHLSKTGSLDKVILEAMACGMNVLSSNDSARVFLLAESIFDQDSSRELADKIQAISKNQQGFNLRDYVTQNHNLENLIKKMSSIINVN